MRIKKRKKEKGRSKCAWCVCVIETKTRAEKENLAPLATHCAFLACYKISPQKHVKWLETSWY